MVLVIFDVDATLVYSNKLDSKCFATTYESIYGLPFPTIDWRKYPHVSDTTIFKAVIHEHFNRAATEKEETYFKQTFVANITKNRALRPNEFHQVPFAKRMIEQLLGDDRFIVGVATGGWKAPAIVKLNFVNIPANQLIITGADGKETREEILKETITIAQTQYENIERIVYVGDAIWDITTTRNMNLPLIGIRYKGDLDFFYERGVEVAFKDYENSAAFLGAIFSAKVPNVVKSV